MICLEVCEKLPGLHFEPTLVDLQASSTTYVIHNLSRPICAETDLCDGKVQLLADYHDQQHFPEHQKLILQLFAHKGLPRVLVR